MKPLRVLVVVALVAVVVGILGTPWMQVVEKNTRAEDVPYTLTNTHTYSYVSTIVESSASTSSSTLLQASKAHLSPFGDFWTQARPFTSKDSQKVKLELHVEPLPSSYWKVGAVLWDYSVNLQGHDQGWVELMISLLTSFTEQEQQAGFSEEEWKIMEESAAGVIGLYPVCYVFVFPTGQLACSATRSVGSTCECSLGTGLHLARLFSKEDYDLYANLTLSGVDVAWTTATYMTTSMETKFSTVIQTSTVTTTWYNTTYKRPLG